MILRPLALLAPVLVLLLGCAHATEGQAPKAAPAADLRCEPADDTVVATYGEGEQVTLGELREHLAEPLQKLADQRHALMERGLEGLIVERLVLAEAKKRGLSEEALLEEEIDKKIPEPPEEELKALYEGAKDQLPEGATYEQMRPQIVDFLTGKQRQEVARAYFDKLKEKANVTLTLPEPPRPPKKRVAVDAQGPSRGPDDAKVTIVTFSDFQCPFCSRATRSVDQVLAKYPGQVRLVFRNFPLSFHPEAQKAAEAALCAHDQGHFWPMHDLLFANQQALKVADLKGYAQKLGLDQAAFDARLEQGTRADQVARDLAAGKAAGVSGTPAFFINGMLLEGAQPPEEFESLIDAELASPAPAPAR